MPDQFPSVGPVGDTQPTVWDDRPMFALAADVTVYWPDVRSCWEEAIDVQIALDTARVRGYLCYISKDQSGGS